MSDLELRVEEENAYSDLQEPFRLYKIHQCLQVALLQLQDGKSEQMVTLMILRSLLRKNLQGLIRN